MARIAEEQSQGTVEEPLPYGPPGRGGGNGRPGGGGGGGPGRHGDGRGRGQRAWWRRLRWLRFLTILAGLSVLALASALFGMMMAVASDLPQLENRQQYKHEANSFMYDYRGRPIGIFAPPNHTVFVSFNQISPWMRKAMVSIEDRRFWQDPGFDIKGILRAAWNDLTGGSRQGASTIAEQFVKNALAEQNNRTILEKLREAALAFQLTRRWSKQKILTQYLNSVYFGNGAYGIESAARVYFGKLHGYDPNAATDGSKGGCGDSTPHIKRPECASVLKPWEAALLAGMVASPGQLDPAVASAAARARRNTVLADMLQQNYITRAQYKRGIAAPLPTASDIEQPQEPSAAPYFTSWIRPEILQAMGMGRGVPADVAEYRAYYGGLKIHTTLDLRMQKAADKAISSSLPHDPGMTATLVTIDNKTGEVRAMVGGPVVNGHEDFSRYPFNIATEGFRQPGSAFKPFTLAAALESGISPSSVWVSAPQRLRVDGQPFVVHNFANQYSGHISLANATAVSDNSVFAQVGARVGTRRIARMATRMGIRSPVSLNPSMILGGLTTGVSTLDLAHAYETLADGGRKVYNPVLGSQDQGPIGIHAITCPVCAHSGIPTHLINHPTYKRIIPATIDSTVHQLLTGVVTGGTGTHAAINGIDVAGKTGTTQSYADAWFVGWTPQLTTAVWVGYPNKLIPMRTQYQGGPVDGGTYPAIIWHNFMVQALQILSQEEPSANIFPPTTTTPVAPATTPAPVLTTPVTPTPTTPVTPTAPAPSTTPVTPTTPVAPTTPAAPTTPTTPITPTTPTSPTTPTTPGTG
ncbi:MAG TPA: transglycosylase domain-containing protein [Solirubrobacteraceae bacterium]